MKWLAAAALTLGLTFSPAPGPSARADDEKSYVKVEIKGFLRLSSKKGEPPVRVMAARKELELDLAEIPGGPPTEKQLKEWDGKLLIVRGHLIQTNGRLSVRVTQIFLKKNPDEN